MPETWKTVRVFISSTFRDMHAERDHLVKVVFPELRERMRARRLHLLDIDLRWGITEAEAEQGRVAEICLDEIERCRPFFIGILGARYGFVPEALPDELCAARSWLAGRSGDSLTALEIVHGVLNDPGLARRAFFYFRDPAVPGDIPAAARADYEPESEEAAGRLEALKGEIRGSYRPIATYTCHWDRDPGQICGLEAFGQRVLEDLWQAVSVEYPAETGEADPLDLERAGHDAFAEVRSRLYVGRRAELERLDALVADADSSPIVVTGASGTGKSAFLATWLRDHTPAAGTELALAYFVGATPDSTDQRRLIATICGEVARARQLNADLPPREDELPRAFARLLRTAAATGPILLVVDGLDQLASIEGAQSLRWLLDALGPGVTLVASALPGEALESLRRWGARELPLPVLEPEDRRAIVETVLGDWRRHLGEDQLSALLAHPGTESPLFLRVALEELRLFGRFEGLAERIAAFPADVLGLFGQVLERLEADHGRLLVEPAFSLLDASRGGLTEVELLDLLGASQSVSGGHLPTARWARLERNSSAYLVRRGELLGLFHSQLAEAVAQRYPERRAAHARLATYFVSAAPARRLEELPFQLQQAEDWPGLAAALADLNLLDLALRDHRTYEWVGYWRALEGKAEPVTRYEAAVAGGTLASRETAETAYAAANVALLLEALGDYAGALRFAERGLEVHRRIFGLGHFRTATSLNQVASLRARQGHYAEAVPLLEQSLATFEATYGPEHPEVAAALEALAAAQADLGHFGLALPLIERSMEIRERALGPDSPAVAASLSNAASVCASQGGHRQALPLYERALAIRERAFGASHPFVAATLASMAATYSELQDCDKAFPLYERALAIQERSLGPSHPEVAGTLASMGNLRLSIGDVASARRWLERSLAIREQALGPDHPAIADSLGGLAVVARAEGDSVTAERLSRRALAVCQAALPADHPDVAAAMSNLADYVAARRGFDEAAQLLESAAAIDERALGKDHPSVAPVLNNLGEVRRRQGRRDEAEALLRRSLAISERAFGSDHLQVATTLNNLGMLETARRDYASSRGLLERALRIREAKLGPDHPDVAGTLGILGEVYAEVGDPGRAMAVFERALGILDRSPGADPHEVAADFEALADLQNAMGRTNEALATYRRVVDLREAAFGSTNPEISRACNKIVAIHAGRREYAAAIPFMARALCIVEATLGPNAPETAVCRDNLVRLQRAAAMYR